VNAAILLGDALQAAATRTLLLDVAEPYRGPAVVLLQDCVLELCHGQDLDAGPSAEFADVDPVQVAEAKTGSLMGAACGLGALVAGAPPEVVDRLAEVGRTVGVAFQLADDVLGVWGEPTRTGKPAGLDLLECRPTFPIILALRSGTSSGDGLRRWLDERRHGRTSDVEAARALLDSLEVRVACEAEVQRLRDHALRRLNDVPRTDVLAGLVHQILSPPS
jgi:geranylgeranyl diphosphate synthase type I